MEPTDWGTGERFDLTARFWNGRIGGGGDVGGGQ